MSTPPIPQPSKNTPTPEEDDVREADDDAGAIQHTDSGTPYIEALDVPPEEVMGG